MKKLILALLIISFFVIGIVEAQDVTGKYRIEYTNVTELTDNLQLDFAETIANATVTFTAKGQANFDNANGGYWTKANKFAFNTMLTEYAQYRIEINGSNWYLYNVTGSLEASLADTEFWSLVNSSGADIRVFNQSNQLYFWIESWDYANQQATIWVNLTAGSTELNIAYGNPSALPSVYNNGDMVFEFFDDFNDGVIDTNKWQIINGNWIESNGVLSITTSINSQILARYNMQIGHAALVKVNYLQSSDTTNWIGIGQAWGSASSPVAGSTDWGLLSFWRVSNTVEFYDGVTGTTLGTVAHSFPDYMLTGFSDASTVVVVANGNKFTVSASYPSENYFAICAPYTPVGGTTVKIDFVAVLKLADPADVLSTQHYDLAVQNPRLILNGNTVQYNDTLPAGQSVTLSIPSSYFVAGANNITITSDNKAAMDVVIEFDYAFSATVNAIDYEVYYVKNSSISIPANTVSATYTFYLPKRTADYRLTVLLNGANATYSKEDLADSVKISLSLSPGNYSVNSTIRYLLFNVSILDEVSLTPAKVNVSILDGDYVKLAEYTDTSNFKIYGSSVFRYGNYFMKLSSGSSKSVYERTVTLVAHKLNNTVKALVLDTAEAAVSVIFQLNDPYNIYSGQAIIRVAKYVNGQLYDVVSDKVDIENKISAILRYNDKYFISIIDWATGTEQTIGDFIAASSGTKIINAKSIEFNVTTVFDYIKYSVYETETAIVVHYKDASQKTNSLTVEIRDDKGNLLFSETTYQQSYDLVFNKTGATYYQVYIRADTQYGLIEDTRIVGSPAGILRDVIKILPPESVTGFSQDFLMAAISFIVLLFFAALFSKKNNRTGSLVAAVGAGMLWLFGWLPVDVTVLAFILVIAILGKLEEGYRK